MTLFYTYVYYDPSRNNEPIYVGKGKDSRAWSHLKSKKKHPFIQRLQFMRKNNILPHIGIYSDFDEEFAHLLEQELISKFGRKDLGKGSLLNLTDGGEGSSGYEHTCSTRLKLKKIKSDKVRKLLKCPHCGVLGGEGAIHRWHFDKCKERL